MTVFTYGWSSVRIISIKVLVILVFVGILGALFHAMLNDNLKLDTLTICSFIILLLIVFVILI